MPEVGLIMQHSNRLQNLVLEVASVFGIELVLKEEATRLNALQRTFCEDDFHIATRTRDVLDLWWT